MAKVKKYKIDSLLKKYEGKRENLISLLQDVQEKFNYLPEEVLVEISRKFDIPLIDLYGLVTFYKSFSLTPKGKHLLTVCLGTACHVRGGQKIADTISTELNIKPGETTKDMKITFQTVNCLGACALGPIVVVDGKYYGQMNSLKVKSLLKKLMEEK